MTRQKETRLLNAWLDEFRPNVPKIKRCRLGMARNPEHARELKVLLKWADCVIINDGFLEIVEAKIKPNLSAIGQLKGYEKLLRQTPEFEKYSWWPVRLILLSMFYDPEIARIAREEGIEFIVYDNPKLRNELIKPM